ncbi:unnamed protein product [Brachionus calyciflorus]|uniref:Hexosyltransferase n=1 Tax=Brachionus calyciflorus TaxID=104777 RepID=A0A814CIM2_9BILA|nr:unnamed protein product [Brachionus calyciflorus]
MPNFSFTKRNDSDNSPNSQNVLPFSNEVQFEKMSTSKVFYKKKSLTEKSSLTIQTILFILVGVFAGFFLASLLRKSLLNCKTSGCCSDDDGTNARFFDSSQNSQIKIYNHIEPTKNLVFIGVMTAQKFLDTRAKTVFTTWGSKIPGKMSFFSRSGSTSLYDIPLVSLPGVDDAYPPQKKSFMMLKFMHDNYLDKFEWFMRVDDDVYIKPDNLELFLRSLNSSKPQFIGQAGLGNKDEFGLLSLDYDENFCMGGPGMIMSRETLKRVVPHISYCIKNLYSTHEDVEIGRCIRKFVNITCTWSYEMQHIFHHNASGNDAYTKELLSKEVLRAVSLHPIKRYEYQYRLHNFLNYRKIVDLRQRYLELKREVFKLKKELINIEKENNLNTKTSSTTTTTTTTLDNIEIESEFDNLIFNRNDNLSDDLISNRFNIPSSLSSVPDPKLRSDRYDFDFFTRSLFSSSYISPKRGLEGFWKKALAENIRQIMDEINLNSIERGRLIDFKDILYGYTRHHPLYGLDFVLDILLIYRKYEGRKMTVPVRRHAYLRNSYTKLMFREDNLESSIYFELPNKYRPVQNQTQAELNQENKSFFRSFLNFFQQVFNQSSITNSNFDTLNKNYTKIFDTNIEKVNMDRDLFAKNLIQLKTINFVLPLTGRWEIFNRFMLNYEQVCLQTKDNSKLVVVLFETKETKLIYDEESGHLLKQSEMINKLFDRLRKRYQISEDRLKLIIEEAKFSRSIGCELGAASFSQRDLIFFIDVDIYFTRDFLFRARLNTIEFKQVYYPIVFSEYDPDDPLEAIKILSDSTNGNSTAKIRDDHLNLNMDTGYWRQFGFGIVAVYNSDLRRVGGFDVRIVGWGKEDVDLYEKFVKSNLTIFRSIDPGLIHVFHKIECDPALAEEQMIMCLGSKSTSIASQQNLANLIFEKKAYMNVSKLENKPSTNSTVKSNDIFAAKVNQGINIKA